MSQVLCILGGCNDAVNSKIALKLLTRPGLMR
jgi:hypothetical protein